MNFPVSDLTSYQELIEQQGLKSQTNIISLDKIIVDIILSEKTGFSRSQQVWCLIRQRIVDGCASVVDLDYMEDPVEVEEIVAQAGIDIGDTSIGMHVKRVQVPLRPITSELGGAHVTALASRPKLIGGARAEYLADPIRKN